MGNRKINYGKDILLIMKLKSRLLLGICTAMCYGILFNPVTATAQLGSTDDPLVTKSYVDNKVTEILFILNNSLETSAESSFNSNSYNNYEDLISDVIAQIEFLYGNFKNNETTIVIGDKFIPVSVSKNQIILGTEGTEIILRSGKATTYCSEVNGIINLTTGKELFNNDDIVQNNLLLIPRSDGRGLKVTEDAWLMIKGDFSLLN